MEKIEDRFQAIFKMEVSRLYDLAAAGPLDMADIVKLEKLVSAHAKFKPQPTEDTDLSHLTAEELLAALKPDTDSSPKAP